MLGLTNITDMEQQITNPEMGLQNQKHGRSTWNGPGWLAGRLPGWLGGRLAWPPWLAGLAGIKNPNWMWLAWLALAGRAGWQAGWPGPGWLALAG